MELIMLYLGYYREIMISIVCSLYFCGKIAEVVSVHPMKAYRVSSGIAPFLSSAPGEGEWSTSHPGHFTPGK
jgi:hypothetical protein